MANKSTLRRRHARQRKHKRILKKSHNLVNSGEISVTPCLICGAREDLTIHHFKPMRADRFVFLCGQCRFRAHRARYRQVSVPLGYAQFRVRPEAAIPRTEVRRG